MEGITQTMAVKQEASERHRLQRRRNAFKDSVHYWGLTNELVHKVEVKVGQEYQRL